MENLGWILRLSFSSSRNWKAGQTLWSGEKGGWLNFETRQKRKDIFFFFFFFSVSTQIYTNWKTKIITKNMNRFTKINPKQPKIKTPKERVVAFSFESRKLGAYRQQPKICQSWFCFFEHQGFKYFKAIERRYLQFENPVRRGWTSIYVSLSESDH